MARVFISHSSLDNAAAVAIDGWLREHGWDEVFIDFDPERGIAAGERWREALNKAANRCEAVIFLVSRNWLASEECKREFDLAHRLSKRLFGVLVDDISVAELPSRFTETWQFTDLSSGDDHDMLAVTIPMNGHRTHVTFSRSGLARLRNGLVNSGLDPRFFVWPPANEPDREPYRGLSPLDAVDAGIFFGREAPLIEALDTLRAMADRAAPRLMIVQGASGAGKSSFLRAGLLPRLAREDRLFCPLPAIRPSRAVLTGDTGFVAALSGALERSGLARKRSDLRQIAQDKDALTSLLHSLAGKMRVPAMPGEGPSRAPTIVIAVDQAEELFQVEGAEESTRFLELLRDLSATDQTTEADPQPLRVIVLFTIRTDSYSPLQSAPALAELRQTVFSLAPMPRGAFETVIEGPARRLNAAGGRTLQIEPALTAAILADIDLSGGRDALPLLAFTLQRLFAEQGGDGKLGLADYEAFGRLTGAIEAAVAHAMAMADSDPTVPRDPKARLALLRRGLIPWLAGIDPATNLPRRKVARMSEIPEEARPLVRHLIEARLLSTDQALGAEEPTIEPAHEALLRQWGVLAGWLHEDLGLLTTLEGVLTATRDWEANARRDDWLAHTAGRLEDAELLLLRPDMFDATAAENVLRRAEIGVRLGRTERTYLTACRAADNLRRDLEVENARRIAAEATRRARSERIGLVVALVLMMISALAGIFAFSQRQEAIIAAAEAERQTDVAEARTAESVASAEEARLQRNAAEQASANAERQAREALQNKRNAMVALALSQAETDPENALKLVLAAWPIEGDLFPTTALTYNVIGIALAHTRPKHVLNEHNSQVTSVAFSPDGTRIVSGGFDSTLRLWDAASSAPMGEPLRGHEGSVNSVTFSPDGTRIVSGGRDGTLRMWDGATGAPLGEPLRGHDGIVNSVTSVAFSPDGSRIVSAHFNGTLRLWDAATGALLGEPQGGRGHDGLVTSVTSVAFSPDGSRIVSGGFDSTLRLWDAATSAPIGEPLRGHESRVTSVAFSPDGSHIVSGSGDETLRLWDAATGAPIGEPLRGHESRVTSVAFSPDGSHIVSSSDDETLRLWDAATGAPLGKPLRGHEGRINSVIFSPDGRRIVSGSDDYTLRLWDTATVAALGVRLQGHEGLVTDVAFSPDGSIIVSGGEDGTLRLWDIANGAPLGEPLRGHEGSVFSVAFSPNGNLIVSGGDDGTLRLWVAATGAPLGEPLRGHEGSVFSVAFSPDGSSIVSGSNDETLRLWDAATGAQRGVPLHGHAGSILSVAFSPNGSIIVSGGEDGTLHLWDTATGEPLSEPLRRHNREVNSVAFSPDGLRIVSGDDETLRLWDSVIGAALAEPISGNAGWVNSVAVSLDGSRIVNGGRDLQHGRRIVCVDRDCNAVRLWDPVTAAAKGNRMPGLMGRGVNSVAFSADGSRIVSGHKDGTLRLWDAATGAPLGEPLSGHEGWVFGVAFAPDGRSIVSGGANGTLRLWDNLLPGNILQLACSYLPQINGRPDTATDGFANELGLTGLTLPEDCDTYDPPIPPLVPAE